MCSGAVHAARPKSVVMIRMFASLLVLLAASAAAPAYADPTPVGAEVEVQQLISTSQAVAAARRAYPRADVLNARLVRSGRPFYSVRMIENGRRFDVRVDAQTGRVLG